ncbi:RHS repeat protein, partial [Salmonella enterica subsp. salamae]|nr:RHS repeat protein [Salmonella enterica subsp. salamae]
ERWQYDERGWLTEVSHLSEGLRVAVQYGYDNKGRLTGERQTVSDPQTGEVLWAHETQQEYSAQGLANRQKPDGLPPVEWLTCGSGYLAGMKLGDRPLVEYTRDRLHREVQRRFGSDSLPESYELTTTYTPGGQLQQQHLTLPQLDREYGYDEGGRLVRISGPQQTREYRYSEAGRLTGVHTTAANLDITLPYATDPAGNRLPDPEFYPESSSMVWADNRITEDMQYRYRYDRYGRLTEKTDRIPEGVIRMHDERTHRYDYDNQHRLVRYVRTQYGETQAEGRYIYDPTGRRVGKRVWKREPVHWSETQTELSARPYETWYGWEGDRLTTVQTQQRRVQTVYAPGSFTPLLRVETENTELAKTRHRSLAEKLEQEGSGDSEAVQFPAALRVMLDRLEDELRRDAVSEASRAWLTQCGLTAEQMKNQLEPRPEPERKVHLYHCDHRGLPLALISPANTVAWRAEYDEWGNLLGEENPEHLEQLIRLPGQQYDEESGLHYNRHRYYSPGLGRYITQDPVGLAGGWNLYQYPLDPLSGIDPLGLVDINLYPAKDPIHSVANEINISGVFTVGGHGTHTSIESATGNRMMPKDLAVLIKFDANYKEGMPVWLFSCNTGKGQNSFASQLAKELHTNVTGPATLWSWWGRGSGNVLKMDTVLTAPTNLNTYKSLMSVTTKDLGNWVTYGPSGNVISIIPGKPERPGDIK